MKEAKDLFSKQAGHYANNRPTYPNELYQFLYSNTKQFHRAWDCATGNGQAADRLAERFYEVYATDISASQIEHSVQKENIHYSIQRAEHTDFEDNSFDLITIGTALHWFDFAPFYKEVKRVGKEGAIIAAWAYSMFRSTKEVEVIVDWFAYDRLGDYWTLERKYVEEEYRNIPFPFDGLTIPEFSIKEAWTYERIIGYASSWSALQNYVSKHGENPITELEEKLATVLKPGNVIDVTIPICIRAGIIK